MCCGAAGVYSLLYPETSNELGRRKAAEVAETGTSLVASANPGCEMQLRRHLGSAVRVTNIEPGLAETEFSIVRFKGDRDKAREFYKGTKPLSGEDIAGIVLWAVSQPPHVNINRVEVMPVCQSCGPFNIHRENVQDQNL